MSEAWSNPTHLTTPTALQRVVKSDPLGGGAVFTVSVKEVERESPPPVPVTFTVYVPVGVVAEVEIVIVVEQAGAHDVGEYEAVDPVGSPEVEKVVD